MVRCRAGAMAVLLSGGGREGSVIDRETALVVPEGDASGYPSTPEAAQSHSRSSPRGAFSFFLSPKIPRYTTHAGTTYIK